MSSSSARVPRLVSGVDLTKLPLSPLEGFVLSRIDGAATVAVLADLTSLDVDQVATIVRKLIELEAAEWAVESVSLPKATGRAASRTPSKPFEVPQELRRPPSTRTTGRMRIIKRSDKPPTEGVYKSGGGEERVERRASAYPERPPRSSHTGSIFPSGEVDEDVPTDRFSPVPAADAEALADELGALLDEAEALTPSAPPKAEPRTDRDAIGTMPTERPPPMALDGAVTGSEAGFEPATESEAATESVSESESASASASESASESESESEAASESASESEAASEAASESDAASDLVSEADPPSGEEAVDPRDFAPAEEDEDDDLDIPEERRKRVDDLYVALDLLDHYEVLGVGRDATRKDVRTAYFTLSKVFHPDTMFRKRLGSYKAKMEAIFHRLTEAYEVLGKKRARADYDRYLATQDKTRAVEAQRRAAPEQADRRRGRRAARTEMNVAAGGTAPDTPPPEPPKEPPKEPPPVTPSRPMSEEAIANKRRLMAQKLRSATRASRPAREPEPEPAPEPAPRPTLGREAVLRELAGSLKSTASVTGGIDAAERERKKAVRAERDGDLVAAVDAMRLAMELAPERQELVRAHARLENALNASLVEAYEEQARYEQANQKWQAAALSWAKVASGRPDDPMPARRAADMLLAADGDLHEARVLAQKAADLDPDDVRNLRVLARVYIAAKLPLNARRVLERAATLDPEDQIVENLLRDLGG